MLRKKRKAEAGDAKPLSQLLFTCDIFVTGAENPSNMLEIRGGYIGRSGDHAGSVPSIGVITSRRLRPVRSTL